MKKVLFFDWYNTLSPSTFWEHINMEGHPNSSEYSKIITFLFKDKKFLNGLWMRNQLSMDEILLLISHQTKLDTDWLKKELEKSCASMKYFDDSVPDKIKQLKNKGYKCVIATDNMDTFRKFTVPALGLEDLFDDILTSNELGVLKYDKPKKDEEGIPFFNEYLDKNNLSYKDVVLIDDCLDSSGYYDQLGFDISHVNSEKSVVDHINYFLNC